MLAVTPYPTEKRKVAYIIIASFPRPFDHRVQHTSLSSRHSQMALPKPYFLRRTPGTDTFNTVRKLVKHLLTTSEGPQTTRALFAAGTQLNVLPGTDTPLRRVAKNAGKGEGEKEGQHVVRSLS